MKKIAVLNKFKNQIGQSLVEVVFSIGVVALVITGAVILIINALGVKNDAFLRKRAADAATYVMEDLVDKSKNEVNNFWNLTPIVSQVDGFNYNVVFDRDRVVDAKCNVDINNPDCVTAVITVSWGNGKILTINRFFQR